MLNRVDIIGRLGRDPETRYTAGGDAVCTLSVATTERWTDRATGERQESTEWHRVALFGKLAETAQRYLQRGGLVYVSGRIRTRQFTDAEGVVRFSTSVHADVLRMLGGRPHDEAPLPQHVPDAQSTPGRRARRAAATQAATEPEHLLDDDQDDIPF